ncbi:ubiquitin/ISG15-conjugating enzyme E2 L6 [Dromaius novaehollandiae]|uniref:ubiquitin/ISG15-conjugating enzyme E2 L6 n=1 Tax=Dromaius novaehollandiae TaxID=8790 RepID=UPI00311E972C
MAWSRRLAKELEEARRWEGVCALGPLGGDVLRWGGLLLPNNPPYNGGAFRLELSFSPRYPLVPPRVTFRTPIYHPGVDQQGRVCQPLTASEHWKPTTRVLHVLQDLLLLVDNPDAQRVLRQDLARELATDPQLFQRRAEEHTRLHSEGRPPAAAP